MQVPGNDFPKWQTQVDHYYYFYPHLRNKLEHLTKPRITLYVLVTGLLVFFVFLSKPLYLLRYNKFWGGLTGQKTLILHVNIFFSVTLQLHFGCFVKLTSVSENPVISHLLFGVHKYMQTHSNTTDCLSDLISSKIGIKDIDPILILVFGKFKKKR